ncbi:MAG TPA: biosynthetic peptidoglycan transglycosylase [Burkholderiaceae bacterium]|nr:biosynthetic peptidoglycan transglycosylase [Burkholderiaceae bacterium]HQR69798.1 biosynthetic peptidoglycan transglycosylase [Burkholderiaceae bacterium]
MTLARIAASLAAGAGLLAIGLAGAAAVTVIGNGVLTTSPEAWTTEVRVLGRTVALNVLGLVRLATAPGVALLVEGRAVNTRMGRVEFRREGVALIARCAPCRLEHPALASTPLVIDRIELAAERSGSVINGWVSAGGLQIDYTAELAPERIVLRWHLPPAELARAYHAIASIVPEAQLARIDGRFEARGRIELPRRTGSVQLTLNGVEVGGLGTEALQSGWFAMACRQADGVAQRVVTGDSELRWVPLDRMGTLPSAVIAAEDQRFYGHPGFDEAEIGPLLASLDASGRGRGASTLTQQLARTLFTGGERTAARKLREFLYAVEMERTLGKARILELYLNTVDWGPGLCGARAASRTYFRKRPDQLTPLESAWLAGILRAPHTAYEQQYRAGHPDAARAQVVLLQMRSLPKAERERWARRLLVLAQPVAAPEGRRAAGSAHRHTDRDAAVAKAAVETAVAPRDRSGAVRTAAVVR